MSGGDILKILESKNDWCSLLELMKLVDTNETTLRKSLQKLKNEGFVESKPQKGNKNVIYLLYRTKDQSKDTLNTLKTAEILAGLRVKSVNVILLSSILNELQELKTELRSLNAK